jgi:hypothetical protein
MIEYRPMKKITVSLFLGLLVLPFSAFAETQEELLQHISLLQQVVVLLEQELAILTNMTQDTQEQVVGNIEPAYAINVSVVWSMPQTAQFTIDQPYTKARLSYWKDANPEKVYTTWGIFNGGPAEEGFDPNTAYHWEIEAVSGTGEHATTGGAFTTGDYSL